MPYRDPQPGVVDLVYEIAVRRFQLTGLPMTHWNMNAAGRKQVYEEVEHMLGLLAHHVERQHHQRMQRSF